MQDIVFNPLEEFEKVFKEKHKAETTSYFEELVKRSGVNIEENRKTVAEYNELNTNLGSIKRKKTLYVVLRVVCFITLILIPLVFMKLNPIIKQLTEEIDNVQKKLIELLELANKQMLPLNCLFTNRDSLVLVEKTVPLVKFSDYFSAENEREMKINYDFKDDTSDLTSSLDVLYGEYNGNPFLFENKLVHTMGSETYHGYKTISWVESYRDSDGKMKTRTRTDTLHATVVKPKPFYSTQIVLNYGAQAAPELCFSRDASHLDRKGEFALEMHLKKGQRRLKRKTDKAIRNNEDFVSMSNTDFEVLFDALDRTDEVQFRTLFTPLAQTNMTSLILSKTGYGDDFNFFKIKRMNKILSTHSRNRQLSVAAGNYMNYSFDVIKSRFETLNEEFFKAVYFDFAPLLAIPAYQERPVHSLNPMPDYSGLYSMKECEALANMVPAERVVHPATKTKAILKACFVDMVGNTDRINVEAYSYDIEKRTDIVSVYGGDGKYHNVPVEWDEYLPLSNTEAFGVCSLEYGTSSLASRNGIGIF